MVAISGANVTGYVNPIHRLAEKAHKAGAQIMIDCAQALPRTGRFECYPWMTLLTWIMLPSRHIKCMLLLAPGH